MRLAATGLASPGAADPAEVVRSLLAVQAQELAEAPWAVTQRSTAPSVTAVREALDDGRLVRTHLLRPTWHVVTADDLGLLLSATAQRVQRSTASIRRQHGLDDVTVRRALDVVERALAGGDHLTRAQLRMTLAEAGLPLEPMAVGMVMIEAELAGLVVSGARTSWGPASHTYARTLDRDPGFRLPAREGAVVELARRYVRSHGPTTWKDLRWWSSLTAGDLVAAQEVVAAELEGVEVGGDTYWYDPEAVAERSGSPVVRLVGTFDELLVGYQHSRAVATTTDLDRPLPPLLLRPVVVLDGRAVGTWRAPRRSGEGPDVDLHLDLTPAAARALEDEIERYRSATG